MTARRAFHAAALLLLVGSTLGAFYEWGGPGRQGVRELRARRYAEALRKLREARASDPRSAALAYDQALAHAGSGAVDSARALYREAMDGTGSVGRAAAAYNLGNDAMRARQFAEAKELYRESLRARSEDLDAKRNLEEAIRMLRGTPPPSSPQQGKGKEPPPKSGPNPGNPPPSAQNAQPNPPPQKSRGEFTRQEAEQWLQALEEERKESRHETRAGSGEETGRRDW